VRQQIELAIFRAAYRGLGAVPRPRALRIGAALGAFLAGAARPQRRIALHNLRLAFPQHSEAERRAILRRSGVNLGRMVAEVCHLEALTRDTVERYVTVDDPGALAAGLAAVRERGGVILTGHFGNWELLAYAYSLLGHPVTLVHRPLRNALIGAEIDRIRTRAGTRSMAKKAAARELLRALERRELVAIPADQNQTRRYGVFVDFFGVPASTTPGPARLALRTGAPIYPVFLVREGESERHRLIVRPPVEVARTGHREADILTTTQRCTAVLEDMIRQHPDHWIWFHKRWKTRPLGAPRLY
jgi:KDO2-lipid IV(A) lauroyltransferase